MVLAKDMKKLTSDINNGVENAERNIKDLIEKWKPETEKFIYDSVILDIKHAALKGKYECSCNLPFYPHDDWNYKDDVCWGFRWDYDESKFEKACLFIRELKQLGYEIIPVNVRITGYRPSANFTVSWSSDDDWF